MIFFILQKSSKTVGAIDPPSADYLVTVMP
jgi:hypothetical protein